MLRLKFLTRQFGSLMNNFSLLCLRTVLEAETCGMGLFTRMQPLGMRIASGVRYVNFRLHQNKTVPSTSYLKTQAGLGKAPVQFRVTHEGQVRTCRHCDHPGHLAGDCPQRSPTRGEANASSTSSDRTNHDCTLNTNTAPLTTTGNRVAEVTKN